MRREGESYLNACVEQSIEGTLTHDMVPAQGGGALSTCTYGEVSPICLGQNIAKSDIFGSKEN